MNNILLISEDTLKTYSNLNDNTFGKWILPAIKESQEMGLMPIIGECLYNKICELVADGSINDILFTAYKDLLDDKIQPYLIYKTLSNIIPIINAKMANIGTVLTNDEHVINLTQGESDLLKTYYSERCDFYTKRLQDFIKNNQSAFPEISCGCGNMQPNLESSENSVGVWLGGSRGKKIGDNKCACSSTEVTCADYQSGFTDGVEFQKRKLQITAVTENGRYISEDGFKEIAVDVPAPEPSLEVLSVTENGDYLPSAGYDGFSSVEVNVPTGHTDEELEEAYESGYTSGETHQKALLSAITITQNGSYERENGYSAITVNVSGQEPSLVSTAVTANGEFFPAQGYDGFSSVEVNVPTGSTINNQDKNITITANTATTITFDSGYTGLGNVGINVNVPQTGGTGTEIPLTSVTQNVNINSYGRYYIDYDESDVTGTLTISFNTNRYYLPIIIKTNAGSVELYNSGISSDLIDKIIINDTNIGKNRIYNAESGGDYNVRYYFNQNYIPSNFMKNITFTNGGRIYVYPSFLNRIEEHAFDGINLYDIGNITINVEDYAFANNNALSSVIFGVGSNKCYVGEYAFSGCSILSSITINDTTGIPSISSTAFVDVADNGVVDGRNPETRNMINDSSWFAYLRQKGWIIKDF